jgi:hypothetical protein
MENEKSIGDIFYSNLAKCWAIVENYDHKSMACIKNCIFYNHDECNLRNLHYTCLSSNRADNSSVIFTKIPEIDFINEHKPVEGEYFIFNNRIYKTMKYGNVRDTFSAAIPDNVTKNNILYHYAGADINRLVFKFIQKCDNKINNMEEEGIVKLTLDKAKEYYNGDNEALKEIAKQAFKEDKLKGDSWERHFINTNGCMNGFVINALGIIEVINDTEVGIDSKRIFKDKKHAISALAYAQLTQLMASPEYNGGWEPDWHTRESKSCLYACDNSIKRTTMYNDRCKMAFKTDEIRDKFLSNFEFLLKQYFELD